MGLGESFADHSLLSTILVSQVARVCGTVILSSDGGDEKARGVSPNQYIRWWSGWPRATPSSVLRAGQARSNTWRRKASWVSRIYSRRLLSSDRALDLGLFQADGMEELLNQQRGDQPEHRQRIWSFLMLELWFQIVVDQRMQADQETVVAS